MLQELESEWTVALSPPRSQWPLCTDTSLGRQHHAVGCKGSFLGILGSQVLQTQTLLLHFPAEN